ncbi:hypothetical protein MMC14_010069 [Varicellaria rhodocarpa]|nr:hypothetical protein [Varicellaria rhodocarpa]
MTFPVETILQEPTGAIANRAYRNARERYRRRLSTRDFHDIKSPKDIEEIASTAASIHQAYETKKGSRGIQWALTIREFAPRLWAFGELIQDLCGMHPLGGFLWSSINFVLKMVRENYETTKLVLDFFVKMGDRMPRFESLATTFNHSKLVTNALENVYEAMLEFWTPAFKFYNSK